MTKDGMVRPVRQLARPAVGLLAAMLAGVAFFLLVHNYALDLLPHHRRILSPDEIKADATQPSWAYYFHLKTGWPDQPGEMRSRLRFWADDRPYQTRLATLEAIRLVGGDRYSPQPGGDVVFSTVDNSDPRTNGRLYAVTWPLLYSPAVGRTSLGVLAVSLGLLVWAWRPRPAGGPERRAAPRWTLGLALVVLAAGLWCNTGTRAPYAITFAPVHIDPATGFVYNQDHIHFRVLFDFVDGAPREVWDKALLLRRVLYPVIAYPAMKLAGYEAGGVGFNLVVTLAVCAGVVAWLGKREGPRAAWMGAGLLATYPGFAYWVGMPYGYALIAPGSLFLLIALTEIARATTWRRTLAWALGMGVMYLAYDFAPVFLPATGLLLLWRRRWRDAVIAGAAGVLPLACWMLALRFVFDQTLETSNSSVYRSVLVSFLDGGGAAWLAALPRLGDVLVAAFFGANFIFLPMLFLGVLMLNRWSSRVRLADSELAVLGVAGLLFVVINGGSGPTGGWNMSGSWISRLYQVIFPCLIFFVARWWQAFPAAAARPARWLAMVLFASATLGNLLVIFGPVGNNPLGVSGDVFYRFYTHDQSARMGIYEFQLRTVPTRLFGFGQPVEK